MSPAHNAQEKTCIGCGLIFRWRNELDRAWQDLRYCSSSCQRREGLSKPAKPGRRTSFPLDTQSIDRDR